LYEQAYAYGLISHCLYKEIKQEYEEASAWVYDILQNPKARLEAAQLLSVGEDAGVKRRFVPAQANARQAEYIYAELLYAPYKEREEAEIKKAIEYRELKIPPTFLYRDLPGLSHELQEKLESVRPQTIAQAGLISGMTPAALSLLIFNVRQNERF